MRKLIFLNRYFSPDESATSQLRTDLAFDLAASGYEVHVLADAVSSRTAENKAIGLQKMKDAGAGITSVETALFELLRVAEGPTFKQIIGIVK